MELHKYFQDLMDDFAEYEHKRYKLFKWSVNVRYEEKEDRVTRIIDLVVNGEILCRHFFNWDLNDETYKDATVRYRTNSYFWQMDDFVIFKFIQYFFDRGMKEFNSPK